jgi:putative membrane protein insertion efficiency factor
MNALRRFADGVRAVLAATVGRVIVLALVGLIRLYQLTLSPLLPPSCRYHPSCSAYAVGALRTHGALKGPVLAAWRLARCNPWSPGGLDPVPPRGSWRPPVHPDGSPRGGATAIDGPAARSDAAPDRSASPDAPPPPRDTPPMAADTRRGIIAPRPAAASNPILLAGPSTTTGPTA